MSKKFIKGVFHFKKITATSAAGQQISVELIKLADRRDYAIEAYCDEENELLHISYLVDGSTKAACCELVHELKAEARKHGAIQSVWEGSGDLLR